MSQKKISSTKHTPEATSNTVTYVLGGVAFVVVVIVIVVAIMWQSGSDAPRNDGYGTVKNPAVELSLPGDGVVTLARPGAERVIDVFEDPMCPFCGDLEVKHGQELAQKIDDGVVSVNYHLVNFLDPQSASGDYSTRAVAASHCVAETENARVYSAFHSGLFDPEFRPEEGGDSDRTDAEIAELARSVGASDLATECIVSGAQRDSAVADANIGRDALAASGARGTPGVLVDGEVVDALGDSEWLASIN
ncbi:DsbA family protein [Rhodococcus sp. ARC_M12]|uniref:DsbA family protein n=1 Tax=unclassified Rhodococcus (in: high G+C Gram-positive bacteria) TaxID=192944 RepID=UPI001FB4DAA1|nr:MULTISPECIES: DsbA family protein [unclassified Rhodococcus (in: high G+C Gram-positive bacteria)]MCJ0890482.1 DsbA family protein [Rhodococcus sp. ARC_M5]MCJ0976632.1 DsbA family protein [Rhodococcus sp. ARC_M12]